MAHPALAQGECREAAEATSRAVQDRVYLERMTDETTDTSEDMVSERSLSLKTTFVDRYGPRLGSPQSE